MPFKQINVRGDQRGDPVRVPPLAATPPLPPCVAAAAGCDRGRPVHADLLRPLVDALTMGASDAAGAACRVRCLGGIVALAAVDGPALTGLQAIVPFTLKTMSDVSRDAFAACSASLTDWHATAFAGSTVRKITRACGRSTCSTTRS